MREGKAKCKVRQNTQDPVWHHQVVFEINRENPKLLGHVFVFHMLHKDMMTGVHKIGQVSLNLFQANCCFLNKNGQVHLRRFQANCCFLNNTRHVILSRFLVNSCFLNKIWHVILSRLHANSCFLYKTGQVNLRRFRANCWVCFK